MALRERNDCTEEGLVPRALAIQSSDLPSWTQRRMSFVNFLSEILWFIPTRAPYFWLRTQENLPHPRCEARKGASARRPIFLDLRLNGVLGSRMAGVRHGWCEVDDPLASCLGRTPIAGEEERDKDAQGSDDAGAAPSWGAGSHRTGGTGLRVVRPGGVGRRRHGLGALLANGQVTLQRPRAGRQPGTGRGSGRPRIGGRQDNPRG